MTKSSKMGGREGQGKGGEGEETGREGRRKKGMEGGGKELEREGRVYCYNTALEYLHPSKMCLHA